MRSIGVNLNTYDIEMSPERNLDMVVDRQCVQQDVMLATQMLTGEFPYDTTRGVPYMENVFKNKQIFEFEENLREELLRVPNVSAVVDFRLIQVGEVLEFEATMTTPFGPVTV